MMEGRVGADRSAVGGRNRAPLPQSNRRASKERILSLWEERLRNTAAAAGREPSSILINTLPAGLNELAEALSPEHPRKTATDGSTVGQEHGGERVRLTHFRLEDLITEYRILRQVPANFLEESGSLSANERNTLNTSLDQMMMEAGTGYALVQSSFRDQFLATVAHDLRNPLNAAQASAALILRDPRADGVTSWAARIIDNISRADRWSGIFLDAMRVQTGARLNTGNQIVHLVEVVQQALDRFQDRRRTTVSSWWPQGPLRGHVAPDALGRAVENLISNALKYGVPSRPITVTLNETHGRGIVMCIITVLSFPRKSGRRCSSHFSD